MVVHSVQQNTDWFDNPVETTGLYAGSSSQRQSQELLVLTPEAAVEQADSIKVTFENGKRCKWPYETEGCHIQNGHSQHQHRRCRFIAAAGSGADSPLAIPIRCGREICFAAVGSPAGWFIPGLWFCFVCGEKAVPWWISTAAFCIPIFWRMRNAVRTFDQYGWRTGGRAQVPADNSGTESQVTEIFGISDYKGILEKLSNGQAIPCIGIVGQEVTDVQVGKWSAGRCLRGECRDGKPAYNAGIQNGGISSRISMETGEIHERIPGRTGQDDLRADHSCGR